MSNTPKARKHRLFGAFEPKISVISQPGPFTDSNDISGQLPNVFK